MANALVRSERRLYLSMSIYLCLIAWTKRETDAPL